MVFCFRKLNVSLHLIIGSQTAFCVTWLVSECMHVTLTFPDSYWMKEISVLYNQVLQCYVLEDSALCSQIDMVLLSAVSDIVWLPVCFCHLSSWQCRILGNFHLNCYVQDMFNSVVHASASYAKVIEEPLYLGVKLVRLWCQGLEMLISMLKWKLHKVGY